MKKFEVAEIVALELNETAYGEQLNDQFDGPIYQDENGQWWAPGGESANK